MEAHWKRRSSKYKKLSGMWCEKVSNIPTYRIMNQQEICNLYLCDMMETKHDPHCHWYKIHDQD